MAMKPCKRCWNLHTSAAEARQCWTNHAAATYNPDVQARQRAEAREARERHESIEHEDRETRARREATEVRVGGTRYRSADSQLAQAATRFVNDAGAEGRSVDPYAENSLSGAYADFLADASAELEDVEVFTVEDWTIPDERLRDSGQAAFSLREDEEVPGHSVYDEDHGDYVSPHWHPTWCGCWHCTQSAALSVNWSEDDWAG